jgi:protein TonB
MRWFMLPLSIGVHVALGLLALIVPLGADEPPVPPPFHAPYVTMKASPVPAAAAPATVNRHTRAVNVIAPSAIERELEIPAANAGPLPPGPPVQGGLPFGDLGAPGAFEPEALVVPPQPPPAGPARPAFVRAGQGVREPKKIVDVRPVYPEIAQRARVEGSVLLEAVINERGVVERVKVLRSIPLLDGAAVAAVQAWRYTPTTLNGVPVSVLMTITVNFTLHN